MGFKRLTVVLSTAALTSAVLVGTSDSGVAADRNVTWSRFPATGTTNVSCWLPACHRIG